MRRHIYLVVDSPHEEYVGKIRFNEQQLPRPEKNEQAVIDKRNLDAGETYEETLVGMGYADFDDREDYEGRWIEVGRQKLSEIDEEHLEAAGLEPKEVLPAA